MSGILFNSSFPGTICCSLVYCSLVYLESHNTPKLWGGWRKSIKNKNKTPKPFQTKPHNLGLGILSGLEPVRVFGLVHKKLTSLRGGLPPSGFSCSGSSAWGGT